MKKLSVHELRKNITTNIDPRNWSPSEWKQFFEITRSTDRNNSIVQCHYQK